MSIDEMLVELRARHPHAAFQIVLAPDRTWTLVITPPTSIFDKIPQILLRGATLQEVVSKAHKHDN